MSALPSRLLLDTNVWLDAFVESRAGHFDAKQLLGHASAAKISLLYSPISLKDVEYIAAASFKRDVRVQGGIVDESCAVVARQFAWSCVQNMRRIATAVGADESDLWLAEKYHKIHPDFEDDLILAAAKRCNPDYLVTRDRRLLEHAVVPALTPSDVLTLLHELAGELEGYESGHRGAQ